VWQDEAHIYMRRRGAHGGIESTLSVIVYAHKMLVMLRARMAAAEDRRVVTFSLYLTVARHAILMRRAA